MRGVACASQASAFERVRAALGGRRRGQASSTQARSEDGAERRGAGRRDPHGTVGEPVRERRAPEGAGALGGQGDRGGQEPGPEAHAGEWVAGAGEAGAPARRPEPRRADPDGATRRVVGHGRGAVLDAERGLVLVLSARWTTASRTWWAGTWRRRGTAGRRWSLYGRVCGPTWGASARRSPRASASDTTGARSTGGRRSRRRSSGSGSAPHRRTWVSPSATASRSGSSAP